MYSRFGLRHCVSTSLRTMAIARRMLFPNTYPRSIQHHYQNVNAKSLLAQLLNIWTFSVTYPYKNIYLHFFTILEELIQRNGS